MRLNDIDLNLMKFFVGVAEEKSFTLAAKKLFVEQSAVSKAIKRFEEGVGVSLFLRNKRHVQLTSKGESLYYLAKNILLSSEEFLKVAQDKGNELSGALKFGAESPLSYMFMPKGISKISKSYPKLWPMMFTGVTSDIVRRVKERELEFAFLLYEANRHTELIYKEIGLCTFRVVSATKINPSSLNSFIGSREVNEQIAFNLPTYDKLKKLNKSLSMKYSANDINAYKELILEGMGIGLLPELLIKEDLKNKKLKVLYPDMRLQFPIYAVFHGSYPLSLEANSFIESMKEQVRNLGYSAKA